MFLERYKQEITGTQNKLINKPGWGGIGGE